MNVSDPVAAIGVTAFLLGCTWLYARRTCSLGCYTQVVGSNHQEETMTTITTITVDPSDDRMEQGPYVRIELDGGCGLPGCNCSPEPFILISDGTTLLSVTLTAAQIAELVGNGRLMAQ